MEKIACRIKKLYRLGFSSSLFLLYQRWRCKQFQKEILRRRTNDEFIAWQQLNDYETRIDWQLVILDWKARSLPFVYDLKIAISEQEIREKADQIVTGKIHLFDHCAIDTSAIAWHQDPLISTDSFFSRDSFYGAITIKADAQKTLGKDIRVCWERARFHHLLLVGKAYGATADSCYATFFMHEIESWAVENPFCRGIHWVGPMEVAIRLINWLLAAEFFKKSDNISESFWIFFAEQIYQHFIYLSYNWELYDGKTNNHYLSDLVGYLFGLWFFKSVPGIWREWPFMTDRFFAEWRKQTLPDGTSYEGSTAYHLLVAELVCHAVLLMQQEGICLAIDDENRLAKMLFFIEQITIADKDIIRIGDDDSGKVGQFGVWAVKDLAATLIGSSAMKKKYGVTHFPHFGLSLFKDARWHISLRHHAYNDCQPTGHFHADVGSVTIALDGQPIIVDPGSFVYTASSYWRNYFRSAMQHNSLGIWNIEPFAQKDLFSLDVPIGNGMQCALSTAASTLMQTSITAYHAQGVLLERIVTLAAEKITIEDRWHADRSCILYWNFIFHPAATIEKEGERFVILIDQKPLIDVRSPSLVYSLMRAWYAAGYYDKQATTALRAFLPVVRGMGMASTSFEITER